MTKHAVKVSIVGTGLVGSTIAYTLTVKGTASDIVLIDVDKKRAEGEAMDIEHGSPFFPESTIHAGSYDDARGSDVVVVTAGANQRQGETRMDLINRNASIVTDVANNLKRVCPGAIIVMVSNPLDVMTRVMQDVTGFPAERVIGTGTNLDSARFRYLLSQNFGVDARNIHGYILGEHGDSEFAAWSNVHIAGMNINEASDNFGGIMGDYDYINIENAARNAAYEIINRKKATYYGIAASASRIVEAIVRNEKSIFPLSVKLDGQYGLKDVYLSLPTIIGENGVERILTPYLSEQEENKLHHSAEVLEQAYEGLKK